MTILENCESIKELKKDMDKIIKEKKIYSKKVDEWWQKIDNRRKIEPSCDCDMYIPSQKAIKIFNEELRK